MCVCANGSDFLWQIFRISMVEIALAFTIFCRLLKALCGSKQKIKSKNKLNTIKCATMICIST